VQLVICTWVKVELSIVQFESLTLLKVEPAIVDPKISACLNVQPVNLVLRIVVPLMVEFLAEGSVAAISS